MFPSVSTLRRPPRLCCGPGLAGPWLHFLPAPSLQERPPTSVSLVFLTCKTGAILRNALADPKHLELRWRQRVAALHLDSSLLSPSCIPSPARIRQGGRVHHTGCLSRPAPPGPTGALRYPVCKAKCFGGSYRGGQILFKGA